MSLDKPPPTVDFDPPRVLRETQITDSHPGTVLRDFQTLLDFIAQRQPIEVSGAHGLLPIKILPELNARMVEPFVVNLQRPQLRSYPNLQGLYLLLRASGIGVVRRRGSGRRRLELDQTVLDSWKTLNETEKYFTLLEAWTVHGRPEMVGAESRGFGSEPLMALGFTWRRIADRELRIAKCDANNPLYYADTYALMALFGLAAIEQRAPDKNRSSWCPRRIRALPWGQAVVGLLLEWAIRRDVRGETAGLLEDLFAPSLLPLEKDEEEEDEVEDEAFAASRADEQPILSLAPEPFGQLQPLFAPYFPQWQRNLARPQNAFRDGVFLFDVALGSDTRRRIAIPAQNTFDDLADWILRAFDFDFDHLYEFLVPLPGGQTARLVHPYMREEEISAAQVPLGATPLEVGEAMVFHYDFGDDWRFEVSLAGIDPPGTRKRPAILERAGRSPQQYSD